MVTSPATQLPHLDQYQVLIFDGGNFSIAQLVGVNLTDSYHESDI